MMAYYEEKHEIGKGVVMLLLGPVIGLLYVIFLPFIAIATITTLVARKVLGGVLSLVRNIVSFGWKPSEAYLSGRKRKKKDGS
ncbi:MAG: hypothetical protein HY754_12155 [Nitrospirae bacterium]|nr:hypothetical protein [Nitrospirota bacterium]